MIEARHSRAARMVFNPWIDRLMKKSFHHFYYVNPVPVIPEDKALLIAPNHMSWWDGFFLDFMCRRDLNRRFHIMMLEEQLRRYWFFRKLGAFSIEQGKEEKIRESLAYTARLLANRENCAVVFPQGILEPYDKRPVILRRGGLTGIARLSPESFVILPVAMKILYFTEQYPDIIFRFGRVISPHEILLDFTCFEREFRENIDALDRASFERTFDKDIFKP